MRSAGSRCSAARPKARIPSVPARLRHVENTDGYMSRRINSLLDQRDDVQHVDSAEALFRFMDVQQSFERASAVLGRLMNTTSLIDQLR